MNNDHIRFREVLMEHVDKTIESGIMCSSDLENLDFLNLAYKAYQSDSVYKLKGCNVMMFNYTYLGDESIMIVYPIPMNEDTGRKLSEKVMGILTLMEKSLSTIDYVQAIEKPEEKYTYLVFIKRLRK